MPSLLPDLAQVGNLIDIIGSRPKNRDGYSRHLLGSNLHVVLAMVPGMEEGEDEAVCFNPRSLRRIIDELCHEVRSGNVFAAACGLLLPLQSRCYCIGTLSSSPRSAALPLVFCPW